MSLPLTPSPVEALETRLKVRWANIAAARDLAVQTRATLKRALIGLDSEDSSVVVSGSLARDEFTPGSDIDWSLPIDGQADPNVIDMLPRIEEIVKGVAGKPPGREGTFGTLTFSHDLIHQIGGEDDTNRNTTRRILLLLESLPVGRPDAYERVLKSILQRYINEDDGFRRGSGRYHVPRFLQNDFAATGGRWQSILLTSDDRDLDMVRLCEISSSACPASSFTFLAYCHALAANSNSTIGQGFFHASPLLVLQNVLHVCEIFCGSLPWRSLQQLCWPFPTLTRQL